MIKKNLRVSRLRRQERVRQRVRGTDSRPRLCVFRSNKHIYAQIISDESGRTLAAASSLSADLKGQVNGCNKETAKKVGSLVARLCEERGIHEVVFDRNGYLYHGRLAELAAAAREAGLKF